MTGTVIRVPGNSDRGAIAALVERAFGQKDEALLVDRLVAGGDAVLDIIAERDHGMVGYVLFSRLHIDDGGKQFAAVALAPLAVEPGFQRAGFGRALVEAGHVRLQSAGETLAVVVGDPAYYGRFGYSHQRAGLFDSAYQCEAMQALAWGPAPTQGRLIYAPAFAELG